MLFKNKWKIYTITIFFGISGLLAILLILKDSKQEQLLQTQQLLVQEATAHYSTIKELEIWHNKFGGIFKERDENDSYHFKIYSLRPKNMENTATGFAKDALRTFQEDLNRDVVYNFSQRGKKFNFIGVLHTQKGCTQCHGDFVVGEVRGGIEITMPLIKYDSSISTIHSQFKFFYILVIFFFALSISLLLYFIYKVLAYKEQIEDANATLEKKVLERTREVKQLYNREHYLKKLLETITAVNESLISSYSLSSIIEGTVEMLKRHPNYKLIVFGHFDGKFFHKRYAYGDIYNLFSNEQYALKSISDNAIYKSIFKAITTKQTNIDNKIIMPPSLKQRKREEDYKLYASISFTLDNNADNENFDTLTFYTNRENGFDQEEVAILETTASDISMALSAFKQRKMTEKLQKEQINNYEETILAFVDMIEQRDAYTAGHTLRVAQYSRKLARYFNFDEDKIHTIERAAILHDIGKIATPDTILLKPGRLNPLEYNLIQNHVSAGYKMLSKVKMYAELAELMKFHHEHYDGNGYPYGLKGSEIPMEAHILIVADAFDAMTSNRIYKSRMNVEGALAELKKNSGTQFHPKVIEAALIELKDVNIHQTSQMPKSDLEKQRFSYFFNDNLTGLFNEAYLRLVLNQRSEPLFFHIIKLRRFGIFNKKHSWSKGNELLVFIANRLKKQFSDAKIFRIEGDDFLIISKEDHKFEESSLNLFERDPDLDIKIEYAEGELRESDNLEEFLKLLEISAS